MMTFTYIGYKKKIFKNYFPQKMYGHLIYNERQIDIHVYNNVGIITPNLKPNPNPNANPNAETNP
jgi:hypothetical protein